MALAEIIQHQRAEIESLPDISWELAQSERDFLQALTTSRCKPAVIAELKPKSPSVGTLASKNYNPIAQATLYEEGGAAALSVLTEQHYFGGKFADLTAARHATKLPVLCKDFILSIKQVKLARQAGADAVLLIVAALDQAELVNLKQAIEALGMLAVIEVHTIDELNRALLVDSKIILINNRNLWDLSMHPETTANLLPLIPKSIPVISASGLSEIADIKALPLQVTAVLIGSHLMQQADPREFLKGLHP
ncbi:MAG: indole-3-glycerol phosphate synthase TrpC [Gammaproteobacteria bacterium]|nr:indole-3-glycerol phosphate synthase TrpC [Gammaproteobacteria bacterium]